LYSHNEDGYLELRISSLLKIILKRKYKPIAGQGKGKGKGKAFPLQAWTGPWGSNRLRLQNF
jgi:hypothetical protein